MMIDHRWDAHEADWASAARRRKHHTFNATIEGHAQFASSLTDNSRVHFIIGEIVVRILFLEIQQVMVPLLEECHQSSVWTSTVGPHEDTPNCACFIGSSSRFTVLSSNFSTILVKQKSLSNTNRLASMHRIALSCLIGVLRWATKEINAAITTTGFPPAAVRRLLTYSGKVC